MSCGCHGSCASCRRGGPVAPHNFPSRLQARLADPSKRVAGPKVAPYATRALTKPYPAEGQGDVKNQRNGTWQVPAPNWGTARPIKWSDLISSPAGRRVQVIQYMGTGRTFLPLGNDTRPRRKVGAPLDQRRYNLRAITEDQVVTLAKQRAAARAQAAKKARGR
jgi:hypothetical protein